jgi:hypothetical protein
VTDDVITIGPTPCEESCAQLGTPTYPERSSIECRVFRRMLLRSFPPPADESARLVIHKSPYEEASYREVGVRYSGAAGLAYGLMIERTVPTRWDDLAREELIWYSMRRLLFALANRGWITGSDVPSAFALLEPPTSLSILLANRDALYSPLHRSGPFEPKFVHGEYVIDPFGPPDDARVLGPLTYHDGRGLVVYLGTGELRVYRPDLLGPLAYLSDEFQSEETFLVRKNSPGEHVLTTGDSSALCHGTGQRALSDRDGLECEIWRLTSDALARAVSMSLASRMERS